MAAVTSMDPFGNQDQPDPDPTILPGWPQWIRTAAWYIRNPLHNLSHYTLGWAGKPYTVTGNERDANNDGFADDNGPPMICWLHLGSAARPFISGTSPFWYAGWHPTSGKLAARWPTEHA